MCIRTCMDVRTCMYVCDNVVYGGVIFRDSVMSECDLTELDFFVVKVSTIT